MSDKPNQTDEAQIDDTADESYAVGYGKPPASGRFQKGKSGNPRGRPRKPTPRKYDLSDISTDSFIQEELLHRHVTVWEDGKPTKLTMAQALRRSLAVSGLKGNRLAAQNSLKELEIKEAKHFDMKIERFKRYAELKRDGEKRIADYKSRNLPPPEAYPHPDDIELVFKTADVIIHGPETAEEARAWEYWARLRDYLFCNAVRECKGINIFKEIDGVYSFHFGWYQAQSIDLRILPRRYKWKDEWEPTKLVFQSKMSKREWAKYLAKEKSWLAANQDKRPSEIISSPETIDLIGKFFRTGLPKLWTPLDAPSQLSESGKASFMKSVDEFAAFWRKVPSNIHAQAQ